MSEAIYISDPDHNGLEIYRDRPREEWIKRADGNYKMVTERMDAEGLIKQAEGQSWKGMPAKTKIGHIHLHVHDLYESKDFYNGQLGFDITVGSMTNVGMLFLAAGGYHHHIGLNIWAGAKAQARPANGVGIAYYTVILPNQLELNKMIKHLKANQSAPLMHAENLWSVLDPSNVEIRLTIR